MLHVLLTLLCLFASPPEIVVEDAVNGVIELSGVLEGKTVTLSRVLTVKAVGGEVQSLVALATEPTLDGSKVGTGDPVAFVIAAGTTLHDDFALPLRLFVQEIGRPGVYAAQMRLANVWIDKSDKSQPEGRRVHVTSAPIVVKCSVQAKPLVRPAAPTQTLQLARPSPWLGRFADRLLLPAHLKAGTRAVTFVNDTGWPVPVGTLELSLRREQGGEDVTSKVTPSPLKVVSVGTGRELVVDLGGIESLSAGRYSGVLRLGVGGMGGVASAPLVVEVRHGPVWPLLVILAGILVGRKTRATSTPSPALLAAAREQRATTRFAHTLAGTDLERRQSESPLKALLYVLLLFALGFVGFQALYTNGSAVFGAGGLTDYVGLFVWGMGADIVQRGIQHMVANK